jgi:superfamily II DNA/RNA helicase
VKQLGLAGVHAAPIHGDRSQAQRDRALADFQARRVQALVATDVAARGIHVDSVGCVMHFDLPADEKDYLHRSGRTGRAGANGTVVALVGEESVGLAKTIQRKLKLPAGLTPPNVSALPDDVPAPVRLPSAERPHSGGPSATRPHRPAGRPAARRDGGSSSKSTWAKDGRRRDPWATTPTSGDSRDKGGNSQRRRAAKPAEAAAWRESSPATPRRQGPPSRTRRSA